jgi:Flp pilus assembly protein TadG
VCLGVLRDTRGATALVFAISLIAILGFVGIGTEVGTWYLVRREAQGAADAASIAGALAAYSAADPTAAAPAAQALATANGFTDGSTNALGTISVPTPSYSPSSYTFVSGFSSNAGTTYSLGKAAVTITEQVVPLLSGLFGYAGPTVGASSVAVVEPLAQVCALALGPNPTNPNPAANLTIQSGTISAGNCALASNATISNAINVEAGAALNAQALATVGGCCGSGTVTIGSSATGLGSPATFHPVTPNPFGSTDPNGSPDTTFAAYSPVPCASAPPPDASGNILLTSQAPAFNYCSDVDVATGQTVTFQAPGTYIFYNSSLNVNGGNIQCQNCTPPPGPGGISIVFVGTGTLNLLNAIVTTNMAAASNNPTYPTLSGVLFYGNGLASPSILLASSPSSSIDGGVYFPNATLTYTSVNTSSCLSLVAGSLVLFGIFKLSVDDCDSKHYNTPVAYMLGGRIVQ